jgi:large subunit ribosomal protein L25
VLAEDPDLLILAVIVPAAARGEEEVAATEAAEAEVAEAEAAE